MYKFLVTPKLIYLFIDCETIAYIRLGQKRIQGPYKYLWWNFLQKELAMYLKLLTILTKWSIPDAWMGLEYICKVDPMEISLWQPVKTESF